MREAELSTTYDFLLGGGEMGKLIREIDWSKTPVGPVESWPQSLRTSISIMLNTHFPMYVAWGEQFTQFYNDGYRPILGSTKHPAAMGLSTKVTFAEIWNIIGPMFEGVLRGNAVGFTDFMLPLDRHGFTEECYFIFSYSPIKQENGLTGGVLVTVTETSDRVLGERRLKTLREVGDRSSKCKNLRDASECILLALDTNRYDIPFSLFYTFDVDSNVFTFSGSTGLDINSTTLPDEEAINRLASENTLRAAPAADLSKEITFLEGLPWPERPASCCPVVLTWPDRKTPFGLLLLGISPRLRFDEPYQNFFKLLSDQAVTALSNANAFEEARKRAEALAELDRAKTAFFSNISHEFRTPLTLMLGPLEELLKEKEKLGDQQFANADAAHRNAVRLLRMVNTLLDFSRIESGRMQAVFRPVDLTLYTEELSSNFRSIIEGAGLRLSITGRPMKDQVYVDHGMWEKIVLNLLSNAFKYTLEGEISVAIFQEGNNAVLKVQDTGVGIPEKELPHMFERFHRVANSAGRTYEGTGIGLSLVAELVKQHGGIISVESKLKEGSTFTVMIPTGFDHLSAENVIHEIVDTPATLVANSFLTEASMLLGRDLYQGSNGQPTEKRTTRDVRVLIVDDNADMLKYLSRILEPYYTVEAAINGEMGLKKIEENTPELVISDIMMPVMDGVQMLKHIKENPQTANIPVMLLSARAGEESRIEGYDLGADDYLIKPFSAKELLARVKAQIHIAQTRSHLSSLLTQVFDQTPAAITIIRKGDYVVEFANDLYLQIVGKGREFIGRSLFDSIPELRSQGIRELLDNVVETGIPYQGKELQITIVRHSRQEETYFNFIYHPLRERDSSITGVIVVCFEVTDLVMARKRAEESELLLEAKVKERTRELELNNDALTQQKDLIEKVLNSSVDVITLFDTELRFLIVNKKFEELYGRSAREVTGRRMLDLFPRSKESTFHKFLADAVRGVPNHTNNFHSPVTGRIYELYTSPLYHNNEVYAVLAIAHDITDAVSFTRQLEAKNNQLLKINQELEQFAYVASHDLQEPLRKIRTFSSLLEKDHPTDSPSSRYFEKIHRSSERMSSLIKDLLNYSRLSNVRAHVEPVDLNEVMAAVLLDFELMIEERQANVVISERLPVINGVRLQLQQLFSNLVSNALKFSRSKPVLQVSSDLSSAPADKDNPDGERSSFVVITFRDNGIGFDPRFSDQIFTIFQRLHETEATGTGIGLALCKKIAENHNGFIRVESEPGVGSAFHVYLPNNRLT